MSIFGTIYNGLSGLVGFSKGLDTISDNVANTNTTGFKGSDIQFKDLFYQQHLTNANANGVARVQVGNGMQVSATTTRFAQGEVRNTGNDTDTAINGNGYFILQDTDGQVYYTRAGTFEFDNNGYLVSRVNNMRVMGLNAGGQLAPININDYRNNPPQATTEVTFSNTLSTGSTTHEIDPVQVIDTAGQQHNLKLVFTNNSSVTPRSWLVEVQDTDNGDAVVGNGEIRFQGNTTPEDGFNTIDITFTPSGSNAFTFTLNFGEPGSFTGATSASGPSSTLSVNQVDGYGVGSLSELAFDEQGNISISYTNEQETDFARLALAHFENQQGLQKTGNGLFVNSIDQRVTIGQAGNGVFGTISDESIELSNVELTQQFTDLVIVQRGFQASSQVLTVANEMVQELINNTHSRGG